MSDFTAIRGVSATLKELLENEITHNPGEVGGVPIFLQSPRYLRENNKDGISVWLYRIMREPDTLNRPAERPTPTQVRRRPLPLTLHYLVSVRREDPLSEQTLLGKVVQVFHDHAILGAGELHDALMDESQELRVVLDAPTLEEFSRVWDALNEPYRLSVSYTVQVISIDSDRDVAVRPPVLTSSQGAHQIAGEAGS